MTGAGATPVQLPLGLGFPETARLEAFAAGPNVQALAEVTAAAEGCRSGLLFLWGAAGTGKSHLLQGACARADAHGRRAVYLPLRTAVPAWAPTVLDGLEDCDLVCLDDVDALAGALAWERGTLYLYERCRQADTVLLAAAARAPRALALALPDLQSRLACGLTLRLAEPDDEAKRVVLARRAAARGLELPDAVLDYLLERCPRDLGSLTALLERLDAASLAAQRPLTVAFVRRVLAG